MDNSPLLVISRINHTVRVIYEDGSEQTLPLSSDDAQHLITVYPDRICEV